MTKRPFRNKLNDLTPTEWLKFQKSWFIHNPPPRRKNVLRHPAKFPETLAQEFIEFFTKRGEVVLDPMVGTGSTMVAALRSGRNSFGVELNPAYAEIARQVVAEEILALGELSEGLTATVISGDAGELPEIASQYQLPQADYLITSPPYWDMLHAAGAQTQKSRRGASDLDVTYSNDPKDLGNIKDYDEFIDKLTVIFANTRFLLKPRGYLTIIVKNVKKGGRVYPLAWDLARSLGMHFSLKDERIWCQDNQRLAPYGLGSAWVSNTFHHYCLQFRNE